MEEALAYDPETGHFWWKKGSANHISAGKRAGFRGSDGLLICFRGRVYTAHRVAWRLHYGVEPVGFIKHLNGDIEDNRIENLALSTSSHKVTNKRPKKKGSKIGDKIRRQSIRERQRQEDCGFAVGLSQAE